MQSISNSTYKEIISVLNRIVKNTCYPVKAKDAETIRRAKVLLKKINKNEKVLLVGIIGSKHESHTGLQQ